MNKNVLSDDIKDAIRDIVFESHQAIAKVTSNTTAEITTKLAVLTEKIDTIIDKVNRQNGSVAKAVSDIEYLKQADVEVKSSFYSAKWVAGISASAIIILIGAITSLSVYIYNRDRDAQDESLKEHAATNVRQFQQIVDQINNKDIKR